MNKTITGLAAVTLLTASVTATAGGSVALQKPVEYKTPVAVLHATGTVVTTNQKPPTQVTFSPRTLIAQSKEQVAATVTVTKPDAGSYYEVGNLIATGDDSDGYWTESTDGVGVSANQIESTKTNKAILSDGTTFYVNINHRPVLPKPGVTVLDLPINVYAK